MLSKLMREKDGQRGPPDRTGLQTDVPVKWHGDAAGGQIPPRHGVQNCSHLHEHHLISCLWKQNQVLKHVLGKILNYGIFSNQKQSMVKKQNSVMYIASKRTMTVNMQKREWVNTPIATDRSTDCPLHSNNASDWCVSLNLRSTINHRRPLFRFGLICV